MARDHTRVNIDIWGDDDFRELPVDAQALYWMLWTSPSRTYCGAHEWRPGKLAQTASDWTVPRIEGAGAVLANRLFLIIDTVTEECLLRSWIKHDGLWRTPNMAVTLANARADLGSKVLRGVVVHEVKKLAAAEPDLSGWKRSEVVKMLSQNAVDPASIPPFNPGPNGGGNPIVNPGSNPTVKGYGQGGVNPPSNPAPTTATATSLLTTATEGGYVSTEGHQRPHCSRHPHENSQDEKCHACGARREWDKAEAERQKADEVAAKRRQRELRENCKSCDGTGFVPVEGDEDCVRPCPECRGEAVNE